MKSTRKYDHLDADAPLYTDRARKRQKRDEQAPKLVNWCSTVECE